MKKSIFIFFSVFVISQSYGQLNYTITPADTLPTVYLGTSTGIDNYSGMIGLNSEIRLVDKLFLRLGVGIGGWGTKLTGGIKYERRYTTGWAYAITYSSCSGLKDFKYALDVLDSSNRIINKEVTFDLLKAQTFNLSATHNWVFGYRKYNKFYLEFGYAFPMASIPYTIKDGSRLTEESKAILKMVQPGGIILGIGILLGL